MHAPQRLEAWLTAAKAGSAGGDRQGGRGRGGDRRGADMSEGHNRQTGGAWQRKNLARRIYTARHSRGWLVGGLAGEQVAQRTVLNRGKGAGSEWQQGHQVGS